MNDVILNGLFVSVCAILLGYLIKVTTDVRTDVRLVNGRLGKLEERVAGDTKLGDERQAYTDQRLERLER